MKAEFKVAAIAIAAYAVVSLIQTKVMPIPVIGGLLPGAKNG